MMTRKDYVAVANILKEYRQSMEARDYSDLCNDFADYMEKDNPRFQDLTFLKACQVPMQEVEYASPKPASGHVALVSDMEEGWGRAY